MTTNSGGSGGTKDGSGSDVGENEILEIIRLNGTISTNRVRDEVEERHGWDAHQTTILRRLDSLAHSGRVVKKKEKNEAIWMLPETFEDSVTDQRFINVLDKLGGLAKTDEIAEEIPCNEEAALRRLQRLESEGVVQSAGQGEEGPTYWSIS